MVPDKMRAIQPEAGGVLMARINRAGWDDHSYANVRIITFSPLIPALIQIRVRAFECGFDPVSPF
jgi:hypothetical protein